MTQERTPPTSIAAGLLASSSVEVTPKTLAKEADLTSLLPAGKVVFIAHIAGTHIAEMVAAARRLRAKGFDPQPHIPARLLGSRAELADWLARYRGEAGVERALLLAGGLATPAGPFASSMDLLGTGLFDAAGFREIAFAGHPEGNRDIDPDGGTAHLDAALAWKQAFVARSDLKAALVTQFAFDPAPVLAWAGRIAAAGIDLPVRVGLAGPAKPATLLRYGLNCGVGASLRVAPGGRPRSHAAPVRARRHAERSGRPSGRASRKPDLGDPSVSARRAESLFGLGGAGSRLRGGLHAGRRFRGAVSVRRQSRRP